MFPKFALTSLALLGVCVLALAQSSSAPAAGSGPHEVKAPTGSVPIVFDGHVSLFEYADATHMRFPNGHGQVDAYVKILGEHLYFALQIPNPTVHPGDDIVVMLDPAGARAEKPDAQCTRAYIRRKLENSRMEHGNGSGWIEDYLDWEFRSVSYEAGWEVECRMALKSLKVQAGQAAGMGLAFRIWDDKPSKTYNWPMDSQETRPASWAVLKLMPSP